MQSALKRITPVSSFPITLQELKDHLPVDGPDHNDRLTDLIGRVHAMAEEESDLAIGTQTWDLILPYFPCGRIKLPKPPAQSVTSIKYFDLDNEEQTMLAEDYRTLFPTKTHGTIEAVDQWPDTYARQDAVTIRFVCGGHDELGRQLMFLLAGAWNELREGEVSGTITKQVELGVDRILNRMRLRGYV